MTKIYLIRHAEAEGNVYRRMHGQYDGLLTPNGWAQVKALESRFENIEVDACYSSDLTRTSLTASAIYKPKKLPLHRDARFREINMGIWEDIPFGQLERDEPESMRAFIADPFHWHTEGSETYPVYTQRFLEAMDEAAQEHIGQTIAIFAHGSVIRGIQLRLFYTPETMVDLGHCDNTGVSLLTYENGIYRYEFLNDNSHLDPAISTLARQGWWRKNGKKDHNLWFISVGEDEETVRRYWPKEADAILSQEKRMPGTAAIGMLKDYPTGLITISGEPIGDAGLVTRLETIPDFSERSLEEQLLGFAVSYYRKKNCRFVEFRTTDEKKKEFLINYGFKEFSLNQWQLRIDPQQYHW